MNEKREPVPDKPSPNLGEYTNNPPNIDSQIEQYYLELSTGHRKPESRVDGKIRVMPSLMLNYTVRFFNKKRGIDKTISKWAVAPEPNNMSEINWGQIREIDPQIIYTQPVYSSDNLVYHHIPSQYNTVKELNHYRKKFSDYLYRNQKFSIGTHPGLKLIQTQNESRADFIGRVKLAAREERDAEIDKLENKYDTKLDRINSRISRLTGSLSADKAEYDARKREEVFGVGETVLGVLLGRRRSTGITTASRRRRMTTKTKFKIDDTKKEIEQFKQELAELEIELKGLVDGITEKWVSVQNNIVEYLVTPRKTDVDVDELKIGWIHYK
jgi:hypothetical protein